MTSWRATASAAARVEAGVLARSPLVVVFALAQALVFLVLVSLMALTGSKAPTALIDLDHGPYAQQLVRNLAEAHRSFDLRPMTRQQADAQLRQGRIVAAITIPAGFSTAITQGRTVALPVDVDNVDVDMTDDIQRALPAAITAFGHDLRLPQIRVTSREFDLVPYETGYVAYLTVSALALDAFLLAALIGAVAMTREWEAGTVKLWRLAPASPTALLAGKLAAAGTLAFGALLVTAAVVVFGYGVHPARPGETLAALVLCTVIGTCCGGWLGAWLKRSAAIVPLLFGLALPLFVDGGTLEPERFDGNVIWGIAHLTPVYYAVGVLEHAFHRLRVTPEPVWGDALVLVALAALTVLGARRSIRRAVLR